MTIQKYHIAIVDKTTGEIYVDETTKKIELGSSACFPKYMNMYLNISRSHPSACLHIQPIRPDYIEVSLF